MSERATARKATKQQQEVPPRRNGSNGRRLDLLPARGSGRYLSCRLSDEEGAEIDRAIAAASKRLGREVTTSEWLRSVLAAGTRSEHPVT